MWPTRMSCRLSSGMQLRRRLKVMGPTHVPSSSDMASRIAFRSNRYRNLKCKYLRRNSRAEKPRAKAVSVKDEKRGSGSTRRAFVWERTMCQKRPDIRSTAAEMHRRTRHTPHETNINGIKTAPRVDLTPVLSTSCFGQLTSSMLSDLCALFFWLTATRILRHSCCSVVVSPECSHSCWPRTRWNARHARCANFFKLFSTLSSAAH